MSETQGCTGNCESCSANCDSKQPQDLHIPSGEFSDIGKVIAVVSGKGGVGKSTVTSLLASAVQSQGFSAAVLDADITGPSIPQAFGIHQKAQADETGLLPIETKTGIKIMSVNLLLEDEESPVVWRGPVISGVIQQFWKDVAWGVVDYMFVDMPPGTGDVPLTVFQSLPVDGIIVVTTPQDLVKMIVKKAYNMAGLMDIPVIGLVENMSYVSCPDCGKKIEIFGQSKAEAVAAELGVPVLAKLPVDPVTASLIDKGAVELANTDGVMQAVEAIKNFGK
ncbi:MAG: Mrp/NBP35 family ATP-binding protein [Clostridia bacterium]|nr:Mrp/NBP35 family ATP-binding protein [Clostridia bacterium]